MIKDSSKEAYAAHLSKSQTQRAKIYKYLRGRKTPCTRQELSQAMGLPINIVCGRVNELIKADAIFELERRTCKVTGANSHQIRAFGNE